MDPYIPKLAQIIEKRHEAKNIYTFRLRFSSDEEQEAYSFAPGQFNMLYVFGVGEIAISISGDPSDREGIDHTIRVVGTVSRAMGSCEEGDTLGVRGPFGSQWPLQEARGKDVLVITGGLGCAPVMGAIHYIIKRRSDYGKLKILHGIKAPRDLIYRQKLEEWKQFPDTEVHLTSDEADKDWKFSVGVVTNLMDKIEIDPANTVVMMCGPEVMMKFALKELKKHSIGSDQIYLSMERNMKCAMGFCGHCQYGPHFICRDGPILRYDQVAGLFPVREV